MSSEPTSPATNPTAGGADARPYPAVGKADFPALENRILSRWETEGTFQASVDARPAADEFTFNDGPPFANGLPHQGHLLTGYVKDVVPRYRTMRGQRVNRRFGWDCHGLPAEMEAEKELPVSGRADIIEYGIEAFNSHCRSSVLRYTGQWEETVTRQARWVDFRNDYKTMDLDYMESVLWAFKQLWEKGLVYEAFRVMPYSWGAETPLSNFEIRLDDATRPRQDPAITVTFDLTPLDGDPGPMRIMTWTTTPWTIPANQALNVHPDFTYALVDTGERLLLLAEELVESCLERFGLQGEVVATTQGKHLDLINFRHPFYDRLSPVYLADYVESEVGSTGIVHSAPSYGMDDFVTCREHGMSFDDMLNPVQGNGVYADDLPFFGGQMIWKANPNIIEKLRDVNALMAHTPIKHSYMHCWRHKTPVIYRATAQWFVGMDIQGKDGKTLRERALAGIEATEFTPAWGQARLHSMIANRPDWCISRQRNWGVPIPFFLHKQTGELHPNTVALMEEAAKRVEQEGIEAWFKLEPSELLGAEAADYDKVTDTLDVWFDSGTTHRHVLRGSHPHGHESGPRADLYLEGSDQHRGWFHSSLLTGAAIDGHAPYRQLLTHGFTVDAQGRKMSKSIGNVVAPQSVMDKLGADILRLWVASTDYSGEMAVSDEILKRTADVYRRIRNTARFLLSNLNGFDPKRDQVAFGDMLALDQWVVDRAAQLQGRIETAYEEYRFLDVYQQVHGFCARELGGFYLDVIKDRQYTTQTDSLARRSAQTALYHVVEALSRWVAPILSFTAEEIFEHIPGERGDSVLLETYYTGLSTLDEGAEMGRAFWEQVLEVKHSVNKCLEDARNAKVIKGSLAAEVTLFVNDELHATLAKLGDELRFVMLTSEVHLAPLADAANAESTELEGLKVAVSASGHAKCERCWHHRADVGSVAEHPDLCGRCVSNLPEGSGEIRHYA